MTCCPHARRKEELLNKYLLNNSVSGFCINGQAYGFCRCTVAKSRTVDSRSKELTEWGPGGHISGASLGSQTDWFCTRREPTEKFPQVPIPQCSYKSLTSPCFLLSVATNPEMHQTLWGPSSDPGCDAYPSIREALSGSLLGLRACWKHGGGGHPPALWVRGEEWAAFFSSSAQRSPSENVSEWSGHLFLILKKVPCMLPLVLLICEAPFTFPRGFWAPLGKQGLPLT